MTKTRLTHNDLCLENAKNATEYGGKRFLGFTNKGAEVWISAYLNRETKEIKVESTHNLSSLLEDGAQLASRRVMVERNKTLYQDVKSVIASMKKDRGGRVTVRTLEHLDTLMNQAQGKTGNGFFKGAPTTLFIKYVFDAIYTGNVESANGGFRTSDIMSTWGFPKGEYYTIQSNTAIT
tara:strand:+ start:625 stop:1161 length:537 start_codon:yes stop_codon:yes gene_type:complete